jgi:uridine kinase
MNSSADQAIDGIADAQRRVGRERATLIAISGIDASGKGHLARKLAQGLRERAYRVALVGVDGWLRLPQERFNAVDTARHFYSRAIRFEEMFQHLILPLRERRSIEVQVDFTEETASSYRKEWYRFVDVDVILLEGIFLLKKDYRHQYDLSIWIECSFETALQRAVARAQEGLSPAETVRAYESIYFPAQRLHFQLDAPMRAANMVLHNDILQG